MKHPPLTFEEKTLINHRFGELYSQGMKSGAHGFHETAFGAMHRAYQEFFDGTLPPLSSYAPDVLDSPNVRAWLSGAPKRH